MNSNPSLSDRLKNLPSPKRDEPLWEGPEGEGPEGGITFSLLSRFMTCPERFRVHVVEGLRPSPGFNHKIHYGNMWHACEEAHAAGTSWSANLRDYCAALAKEYPLSQSLIGHWHDVCRVQFPLYVGYWDKNDKTESVKNLLHEQIFDVPYSLPSGRTVRLRGKWDGVDLLDAGRGKSGVYLFETKTKGDIDQVALQRQLTFDLQTMLYLVALQSLMPGKVDHPPSMLRGVRYNVVRRPLSGGKGSIRQNQKETTEAFYHRLSGVIAEDPGYYFMRWKTEVGASDLEKFRKECLDPILERLCDWWKMSSWFNPFNKAGNSYHWRHPFGCANTLDEYGHTDLDSYLETGSTVGLVRAKTLFPELNS